MTFGNMLLLVLTFASVAISLQHMNSIRIKDSVINNSTHTGAHYLMIKNSSFWKKYGKTHKDAVNYGFHHSHRLNGLGSGGQYPWFTVKKLKEKCCGSSSCSYEERIDWVHFWDKYATKENEGWSFHDFLLCHWTITEGRDCTCGNHQKTWNYNCGYNRKWPLPSSDPELPEEEFDTLLNGLALPKDHWFDYQVQEDYKEFYGLFGNYEYEHDYFGQWSYYPLSWKAPRAKQVFCPPCSKARNQWGCKNIEKQVSVASPVLWTDGNVRKPGEKDKNQCINWNQRCDCKPDCENKRDEDNESLCPHPYIPYDNAKITLANHDPTLNEDFHKHRKESGDDYIFGNVKFEVDKSDMDKYMEKRKSEARSKTYYVQYGDKEMEELEEIDAKMKGQLQTKSNPRYICDKTWDKPDADVICRQLGKMKGMKGNDEYVAKPYKNNYFGSAWFSSEAKLIEDTECLGNEINLFKCPNLCYPLSAEKRRHGGEPTCSTIAGVLCMKKNGLKLKGGREDHSGMVHIGNMPVCRKKWTKTEAQVVCNQLYKKSFNEGFNGTGINVPVFKANVDIFGEASTDYFAMDEVQCTGKESNLAACTFEFKTKSTCKRNEVVGVMCAKPTCKPNDLIEILKGINIDENFNKTIETINAARDKLMNSNMCYRWKCNEVKNRYQEYCLVKSFLNNAVMAGNRYNEKNPIIDMTMNYELRHSVKFTRKDIKDNLKAIKNVGEEVKKNRVLFANYISEMAAFDFDKSQKDLDYSRGEMKKTDKELKSIMDLIEWDIEQLGRLAEKSLGAQLADNIANLVLATIGMVDVASAVTLDMGDMAENIKNLMDAIAKLTRTAADFESIRVIFRDYVPMLNKLAVRIEYKKRINEEVYTNMGEIASTNKENIGNNFIMKKSEKFFREYKRYEPILEDRDISTLEHTLTGIIDAVCNLVDKEAGVASAVVKGAAESVGTCKTAKFNANRYIGVLKDAVKSQGMVMASYSALARAKFSSHLAEDIKKTVIRDPSEEIANIILNKNIGVLWHIESTNIINEACHLLKYKHFGKEPSACQDARDDPPNGKNLVLLSNEFKSDLCNGIGGYYDIPAMLNREGEPVPSGTIDLLSLLKTNKTSFQIPDRDWLLDNKWIVSVDHGPWQVEHIALYLPPTSYNEEIHTSFKLEKNIMKNETYELKNRTMIAQNTYSDAQKEGYCLGEIKPSPYSTKECEPYYYCNHQPGDFHSDGDNHVYPSLLSKWTISIHYMSDHARKHLESMFPVGNIFYLKVACRKCTPSITGSMRLSEDKSYPPPNFEKLFKEMQVALNFMDKSKYEQEHEHEHEHKQERGQKKCCADHNQYQVRHVNPRVSYCLDCPNASKPKLRGYFCESCPIAKGYEDTKNELFGCRPKKRSEKND